MRRQFGLLAFEHLMRGKRVLGLFLKKENRVGWVRMKHEADSFWVEIYLK